MKLIVYTLIIGLLIVILDDVLYTIELYISVKKLCKRVFKDKRIKEHMATLSKEECKKIEKDLVKILNKLSLFGNLNSFYIDEINNILNKQELFDRLVEDIIGD